MNIKILSQDSDLISQCDTIIVLCNYFSKTLCMKMISDGFFDKIRNVGFYGENSAILHDELDYYIIDKKIEINTLIFNDFESVLYWVEGEQRYNKDSLLGFLID